MKRWRLALATLLTLLHCQRRPRTLTVAHERPFAARIALASVDVYRPLDARANGNERVVETIPLSVASSQGARAIAAAALLGGDRQLAAATLARLGSDDDVENDRAVVSLLSGGVDDALARLDRILAHAPRHPQATWNRGLALAALDLPLSAAQMFDAVSDAGWATEARARAAALRASWQTRRQLATQATATGKALIAGGPLPDEAMVRRFPSFMRHYLYHAVRAAPSRARVEALRPLARALDGRDDGALGRWLTTAAAHVGRSRAELGPRYGRAVIANDWAPARQDELLAALRRAGDDDALIGALVLFNRTGERDRRELATLVERNGDPWWQLALVGVDAQALAARGDLDGAVQMLEAALARPSPPQLVYRRAMLEKLAAIYQKERHRTSDARRWALAAIADIHDSGLDPRFVETSTVFLLGEIANLRDDYPLMRAYLGEGLLRVPDLCAPARYARLLFGVEELSRLAWDEAARELDALPRCAGEYPLLAADVVTTVARTAPSLARFPSAAAQVASLSRDLAAARASLTPSQRLLADVIEARLVISRDRARAAELLAPALARPRRPGDDADAKKARAFAFQLVAIEAGRRGDWSSAVDSLAREAGGSPGERCAVGVAVDEARVVVAVRDAVGASSGLFIPAREHPDVDATTLVPKAARDALAPCASVSVYAQPPVHGRPGVLPTTMAWSYRVGRAAPAPTSAPPRRLVVSDVEAPARLELPPLSPWHAGDADAIATVHVSGSDATPARVLAEMRDATEVEIHAHGLIDLDRSDTWLIALTDDGSGNFALTADAIEAQQLRGRPTIVLGACEVGNSAPYLHERWSLPTALLDAGARAVLAPMGAVPDASAGAFFAAVLARARTGAPLSIALRDERRRLLDKGATAATGWLATLVVFE